MYAEQDIWPKYHFRSTVSERDRISHMIVQHSLTDNPNRHLTSCFRFVNSRLKYHFTVGSTTFVYSIEVHRLVVYNGIRTKNILGALF